MAKLPWEDNTTMFEVMNSHKGRLSIIQYVGNSRFPEGKRYAAFMSKVFEKNYRYHMIQCK